MAINLDTQYGPFPLKVWLIIGVGGVAIGLFVASKQNSGKDGVTSDKGVSAPPPVIFAKIFVEHVPGVSDPVKPIKAAPANPIMPSNPASGVSPTRPSFGPPVTFEQGLLPPIRTPIDFFGTPRNNPAPPPGRISGYIEPGGNAPRKPRTTPNRS